MENNVKQSLEDNLDAILENLPEEFHADLKKSVESAAPAPVLSIDEAKVAAIANLKENPDVDDAHCVPMLEADTSFGETPTAATDAELESQQAANLAECSSS